jgi:hypothetical protein
VSKVLEVPKVPGVLKVIKVNLLKCFLFAGRIKYFCIFPILNRRFKFMTDRSSGALLEENVFFYKQVAPKVLCEEFKFVFSHIVAICL